MQEPPSARTWLYADLLCQRAANLYDSKACGCGALGTILDKLLGVKINTADIFSGVLSNVMRICTCVPLHPQAALAKRTVPMLAYQRTSCRLSPSCN